MTLPLAGSRTSSRGWPLVKTCGGRSKGSRSAAARVECCCESGVLLCESGVLSSERLVEQACRHHFFLNEFFHFFLLPPKNTIYIYIYIYGVFFYLARHVIAAHLEHLQLVPNLLKIFETPSSVFVLESKYTFIMRKLFKIFNINSALCIHSTV